MTVLDRGVADLPLSAAMREGSAAEHRAAEDSRFVSELMAGRVTRERYAAYLLRLRVVYAALEGAVRECRHDPLVAAVHDPDLERLGAIDADLDHWGATGRGTGPPTASPAAAAYRRRLEDARAWGGLLVAHHYTRYLGDLSGGRAIGRVVERTYGLDGVGTAFYAFPAAVRPKPYKDAYRARLDALGLPPADKQRVVDEVRVAFRLNRALLAELAAVPSAEHPGATT